jgi:hypothetical protein
LTAPKGAEQELVGANQSLEDFSHGRFSRAAHRFVPTKLAVCAKFVYKSAISFSGRTARNHKKNIKNKEILCFFRFCMIKE